MKYNAQHLALENKDVYLSLFFVLDFKIRLALTLNSYHCFLFIFRHSVR